MPKLFSYIHKRGRDKSDSKTVPSKRIVKITNIALQSLQSDHPVPLSNTTKVFLRILTDQSIPIHTTKAATIDTFISINQPQLPVEITSTGLVVHLIKTRSLRPDKQLAHFKVDITDLWAAEERETFEKTLGGFDDTPPIQVTLSFSVSSSGSLKAENSGSHTSTASRPALSPSNAIQSPPDPLEFTVYHTVEIAEALHAPPVLETTLRYLGDAAVYMDAIVILAAKIAEIHPISQIAVKAITDVCDLIKKQKTRDDDVKNLAYSMRDMLASLTKSRICRVRYPVSS